MAEFQDYTKWMEAYFDHSIIEVERKALEERASEDPSLANRMRLHRDVLMAYEMVDYEDNRVALLQMYQRIKERKRRRQSQLFKAGSLVGVIAVIGFLFFFFRPGISALIMGATAANDEVIEAAIVIPDVEDIEPSELEEKANEFFQPYQLVLKPSRHARTNSIIQRVQVTYQNEQYAQSLEGFQSIIRRDSNRNDAHLGIGISYMALDSTSLAAQHLARLVYVEKAFVEEARWYLALAYYKEGMVIQALGLLEEIARTKDHFNREEAIRFLEEIQ